MDYSELYEIELLSAAPPELARWQPRLVSAECVTSVWAPRKANLDVDIAGVQYVAYSTNYDEAAALYPEQAHLFSGRIKNRPFLVDRMTGEKVSTGPATWRWDRKRVQEDKLVEDFLNLAHNADDPKRALRFARRYGPLWICQKHVFCHWDEYRSEYLTSADPNLQPDSFCEWDRKEPVARFLREARVADATFEIWQSLRDGEKARLELWQTVWSSEGQLGEHAKLVSRLGMSKQQQWLAHIVSRRVNRRVNITMVWSSDPLPRLVLNTGLGFLPVVWRTIAQRIAGGVSLYTCCGCENLYFRKDKLPKGRRNFCFKCRDGNKNSKRLSAQASRQRQREASEQSSH